MDKLLMFSAYVALMFGVIGTLMFLGCCLSQWHDLYTDDGLFAAKLLAIQGKKRVYPFKKFFLWMTLGLGWFLVWRFG